MVYLGVYGTPASRRRYRQVLAAYLRRESVDLPPEGERYPLLTVGDVAARFLQWAESYYRIEGEPAREATNLVDALRPVLEHYADELAVDFGSTKLKVVRQVMIECLLAPTTINHRGSTS